MTGYVGPHPDGSCAGCGQRMIRITPEQTEHPCCQATSDGAGPEATKALLTLTCAGVVGGIVTGSAEDEAALWLGRLWGRREGFALTARGSQPRWTAAGKYVHDTFSEKAYRWPTEYLQMLTDCMAWGPTSDVYVAVLLRDRPNRPPFSQDTGPCPAFARPAVLTLWC